MADVLLPLFVDGSQLAIPQASPTQNGYLSKHHFILFSGGVLVPVTSFNTRTGEVILLEDDVLAALGYTPLDKHGDTMTGPLQLSGPPTLALHAASKAYVDTIAPQATWYASDFKASGSARTFTGTVLAGTLTKLTLAAASDFVVGQGIFIAGAGAAGAALVTKVDAIDATLKIITLHTAATAAVTSVNVIHDDSDAINAALQAVVDAKGGTLRFHPGTYNVNGPVLPSHNSIIRLPYHSNAPPESMIAVSMIGQPQPWAGYRNPAVGNPTVPQYGVIFQTQVINTAAAIFAATAFSPIFGWEDPVWYNHITLYMDGFTFRTYANPQISALDLGGCDNIILRNIVIDTGVDWFHGTMSTHSGIFGLRTPAVSSGMANDLVENIGIFNYYIGCWFGEMLRANLIQAFRCMVGFQAMPALYGSRFYSALGWHCPTYVFIGPGGPKPARMALDMSIDIEYEPNPAAPDYTPPGRDFYDPDDGGTGAIRYMKIPGDGIGVPAIAGVTGFTKCDFVDLTGQHLNLGIRNNATVGQN